jgi:hypothetical protein
VKPFFALSILLGACCAGCLHYSFKNPFPLPFRSIAVVVAAGDAWTHHGDDLLATELRRELATCPSLSLADKNADAILEVALTSCFQIATGTAATDSRRAACYDLRLTASCTLKDCRSGREYCSDRPVEARVYYSAGPSAIGNRQDAMPALAQELARRIRDLVLGPW